MASGLLAFLSVPVSAQDYIDDGALKGSFRSALIKHVESKDHPDTLALIRQLKAENQINFEVLGTPNELEEAEDDSFEKAHQSTVVFGHLYLCGKCDRWHTNLAGGVILSSEGLVLTNYHVMNFPEARLFGAMTREGTTYLVESVVASSKENDLALVQLAEAIDLPTVSLADSASIGDQVTVISHPDSHFFLQTTGEIARFNLSQPHKYRRMQITADFARGSSGCGVFDSDGKLVGLVTATNSVYYTQEEEIQKDLQMVVKTCIPLESIEELLSTE